MSLSKIGDPVTCHISHRPYYSLEQFRNSLVDKYLEIYGNVIVMEKIHGSNIQIMGHFVDGTWTILLGSRRKWISMREKFNNFQSLFAKHESNIISLFDEEGKLLFRDLIKNLVSRFEIILTFLAVLDLIKDKICSVLQNTTYGKIELSLLKS